jgi:hypothetical protein
MAQVQPAVHLAMHTAALVLSAVSIVAGSTLPYNKYKSPAGVLSAQCRTAAE